jgi:4'-phosphopantetheinyl transferase EntD
MLPSSVHLAAGQGEAPVIDLWPEEEPLVAKAVAKRRREFGWGRSLAREALGQLGMAPCAIGVGERRQPLWPAGVVGTITHCTGFCAAAVAPAEQLRGLGIDAEPDAPLAEELWDTICTPQEQRSLRSLPPVFSKMLFSAKESIFKYTYPLTGIYLDFLDAEIEFLEGGTFSMEIPKLEGVELTGRYAHVDGLVLTAVFRDAKSR